ncbi:MAG: helix-turn-helix domain-containing protein [Actinomycetota bacterium]
MDTRARIDAELRHAGGLDVAELAERLGLHQNTVRFHLGALVDSGHLAAVPQPHAAGPGRPRFVYRPVVRREGTRDEYRLLATMLTAAADPAAAAEAGRRWGRSLARQHAGDAAATETVAALLAEQGFDPEVADGELRMRRCPFHQLATTHGEVVCAVHRGLIDGALEELGSDLRIERVDAFVEPDLCVARLRATSGPSGPSTRAASASPA